MFFLEIQSLPTIYFGRMLLVQVPLSHGIQECITALGDTQVVEVGNSVHVSPQANKAIGGRCWDLNVEQCDSIAGTDCSSTLENG